MRSLKLKFVEYLPFLLLIPFSVTIGLYVFNAWYDLINENHIILYMYLGLVAAPMIFLFTKNEKLSAEFTEILKGYFRCLGVNKGMYLFLGGIYSFVFLWAASKHIATYVERDRWILEQLPLIPFDPPILPRMAMIISWFSQPDLAVPLLGLFFALLWFSFLIYVAPVNYGGFLFFGAIFSLTYFNDTFFDFMYANMELPAAIIAFIGLYGIWKGKYNVGLFFLVIGGGFKNTGIFLLLTGLFLLVFKCLQEGSVWKIFQKLDPSIIALSFIYPILNHWGSFYYAMVVRGGPDYLVASKTAKIFWISSFVDLMTALGWRFGLLLVAGLVGIFYDKQNKGLALFIPGILIFFRSFQEWVDGLGSAIPYSMIFIPAFSFFAIYGLGFLLDRIKVLWMRILLPVVIIVFGVSSVIHMLNSFPDGMSRLNSNFDAYIRKLAVRFSETGTIYQNDISIAPYLIRRKGGDLDAITFRSYPNNKEDFILEMTQSGCRLIIAERKDLSRMGVSESDMNSFGYSEQPFRLEDRSGTWVSYSKGCDFQ